MKCSRILFAALLISTFFYSCDNDSPAGPKVDNGEINNGDNGDNGDNHQIKGELSITFSFSRNRVWLQEDKKSCNVYADIKRGGEPVKDAKVLVDVWELSFDSVSLKQYIGNPSYSIFTPGNKIKFSITIDSITAEEEVVLPGNIGIAAGGTLLTWNHEGNGDYVYVHEVDSDTTYMSLDSSDDVNSIFNVPVEAYPKTGTKYILNVVVRNTVNDVFSSLSPESATITVSDRYNILVNIPN